MEAAVAGILLAAGAGRRLGTPKALVELGGARLVDRGAALLRAGGAAPVIVVTGAARVHVPGTVTVHNPGWRAGMASSLALGLGSLPAACGAAVIALVDQPLIGAAAVQRLVAAYRAGAVAVVATYQGEPRNPVLLACGLWDSVRETLAGDEGARSYLRAHPELVTKVECGDTGSPQDVDTTEDLARARRLLAGQAPG
jgi:CTP:molybdopterin cytidylyltransferase MocA